MQNLQNKEQRLETALEKLKDLSSSFHSGQNDVDSLNVEKNQLQSEKNDIENKYKQLLLEYNNLKEKLKMAEKKYSEFNWYHKSLSSK